MPLPDVASLMRPAIVAFTPRYLPSNWTRAIPIVGTGFVIEEGLVVTNAHVIDGLLRAWRPPGVPKEEWRFSVQLFHFVSRKEYPHSPFDGYARIPLKILGLFRVGDISLPGEGFYYGPRRPDFSVVHVKARNLPKVEITGDGSLVKVGTELATLGFPSGTDLIEAPGWLHQIGPTLQRGIVSAVLPFPCDRPHSYMLNVMSLGGASGSPVFLADTPKVVGILNAGYQEPGRTFSFGPAGNLEERDYVNLPTNLSYVVPSYFLEAFLETVRKDSRFRLPDDTQTLEEILKTGTFVPAKEPGHNEQPKPDQIEIAKADFIGEIKIGPTGTQQK